MKTLHVLIGLALSASAGAQQPAPYCVVSVGGSSCAYYTLDLCRSVAATLNGMCAANPAAIAPPPAARPQPPSFNALDAARYVQEQGELGRQAGERRLAARMAAQGQTIVSYKCELPNGERHYTITPAVGCVVVAVTPSN